ncbi:S9 family peptidase [Terrimonas pollutisoli]|uniref:S9 family peptidase n=1 Tax=Terrimonas pollutisoli TaxID=3034147 RepID=UPI0023EBC812|nr:S9 family peptidase [Terrimonas sp. H1YJ31]
MRNLFLVFFLLPLVAIGQKKQITLEDIYKKGTFRGEYIAADFGKRSTDPVLPAELKDEKGYVIDKPSDIVYSSSHPRIVILRSNVEPIYRRSSKANVYIFDSLTKKITSLDSGKVLHPTLSPDGTKVAYVKDNNLYIKDLPTNSIKAVTTDGKWNYIINGNCDWVYEEEFEFTRAFQWSPKGNYIAYYRFDETDVKEYNMTIYDNAYNKDYRYKYPKAGEANSKVEIHIYDLANGKDVKAQYEQGDIYIPRIKWTKDDNNLVVFWMNRHQDDLKLLATNAKTGASNLLYEEKNKYFVEINDDWWFLKDGKHFLFTSEMNGYRHLYLYGLDGKNKIQVTKGNYEVTEVNGVDEVNKRIFYTVAWPRPMDRNLFVTDFTGKNTFQLTKGQAWHKVEFNDNFTQFYDFKTDINTPQVVTLNSINANKKAISSSLIKTVSESAKQREKINEYEISKAEFIRVPNSKGDTLNGWMLKPANFDASKKYPVLFCNYGGPGSQQVANRFGAVSFWHQLLAQKGFIVVSVDNTGTGFRGEEFKKKTYLQLGKFEIEDQIDAAKYLGSMPFVDKNNIGHWGWSYGGFMSSLAITKGADVFSAAVAVAPVTNWRFYDNIYTERYMRTPQENPKGYDDNSPINHTDKIKGKYLLIHGTADDNVHFQNATQMITALVKSNIDFESAYYPNKNHGISGSMDNTSFHLWSKMTNWIIENMGNENTQKPIQPAKQPKAF